MKYNWAFFILIPLIVFLAGCRGKATTVGSDNRITLDSVRTPDENMPSAPEWVHNAVFYQVYPQSFYDTNADGIGDLEGIIEKLDYIKSLGVSAIWVNPFYVSPFKNAGYDIADFYHVDPRYGDDSIAKQLFDKAKLKGLRVIIDFVPSYTSTEHPWFKASSHNKEGEYSNWYSWSDSAQTKNMQAYANNFVAIKGCKKAYYMKDSLPCQAALNYGWVQPDPSQPWQTNTNTNGVKALQLEMKKIMLHWLELGASGFRVSNPAGLIKNDKDVTVRTFWQEVRKLVESEYGYTCIISDWSEPKLAIGSGFHADSYQWLKGYSELFEGKNGQSPFFSAEGKGSIADFITNYKLNNSATRHDGYMAFSVGGANQQRIANSGRTNADLAVIYAFQLTMPGLPFIYYGDEIGMRQLNGIEPKEGASAITAGARTPMQWNSTSNKGFSSASSSKLYYPIDNTVNAPNVEAQLKDSLSLYNTVRHLIHVRRTEPALKAYGRFIALNSDSLAYPFVYLRANGSKVVLVALNPSGKAVRAIIKANLPYDKLTLLAGMNPVFSNNKGELSISMNPRTYYVGKFPDQK